MSTRSSDMMFLLGAGASVEAGIPASVTMISKIEELLDADAEWSEFKELYHHVKSSLMFAAGLKGKFGGAVNYNIETLVNSLYELERNEEHPLYPFIASWNSRFEMLAGRGFQNIQLFRRKILAELKKWMCPENDGDGDYYQGLVQVQKDLTFPLRVFSLNYDLCIERLDNSDFKIESGFGGFGPTSVWDWERFEGLESGPNPLPQMFLYKLHGSIDWKRDESKNLYRVKQVQATDSNNMEIIFGRDFKLEAADPYLFYAYEFRRYCLQARLIVAVGYSFFDDHINKMLGQALRDRTERRVLVVAKCSNTNETKQRQQEIARRIGVESGRVIVLKGAAKSFFGQSDLAKSLINHSPSEEDVPF